MDLINSYDKLYERWLKEFESIDILPLTEYDFKDFKDMINYISDYYEEGDNAVKSSLIDRYKTNFSYLFEDLMEMRKIKIINAAFQMKDLDLSALIEAEQLLYKNLVGSVKGYQKILASASLEDIELSPIETSTTNAELSEKPEILPTSSVEEEEIKHEIKPVDATPDISDKSSPMNEIEQEKSEISSDDQHLKEKVLRVESIKNAGNEYLLIRFLEDAPPLVGFDTLTYGPFEKEDVASIPHKNALILLQEKVAERIEIR